MIKRVAIGSTLGHDYSAFLPVTGLLWRERIGFEPTFFLVGTEQEWREHKYCSVVMRELDRFSFHYVFVPYMEGVEDPTISQCVRNVAAVYPYDENDFLIISDADLLPIRKEFYHQHDPEKHAIALFYSNAYPIDEFPHWASCHYSMKVKTWREVMKYEGSTITDALAANFKEYGLAEKMAAKKADPKKWVDVWFTDELVASRKIAASKYYPDQIMFITRDGHPPKDRLDRASWPFWADISKLTDCHSLRPLWNVNCWPRLRPVLHELLPTHKEWLDQYRDDFWKAIGVDA